MERLKLGVIGAGKIGEALIGGLLKNRTFRKENVIASTAHEHTARAVHQRLHIKTTLDNLAVVQQSDIVLLGVKPHHMTTVLKEIQPHVTENHLLISVVTGVPTYFIEETLQVSVPVIRAMPNTPAFISMGMTVLCNGLYATTEQHEIAERIFNTIGRTAWIEESMMNAATGLSASGPAYIYVVIESLAEAGVKVGFSRDLATLLAAQTVLGAAGMVLETNEHPAKLKDSVTTPAGVTIDGLLELEEGKLRVTLIKAIMMAAKRAEQLFDAS
ncbi:MAG: pyrroline-5-carboxylate reductase [Gemmatimonadetes bacterium]|nr:MAG: pyrroline-5-carboxylate reductase [Gemmatimonadota bacterium]